MLETYSYAGDGKRRQKVNASGTVNYLWDQENVLAELDGSRVTQAQYTQFPGEWGGLVSQRRSGTSSFYGFDLTGNTRALLSPAAGVTDRYRYKAFGDELPPSGTTTNPHRYCGVLGYQRDSATRLYVRARHLGVTAGRWMNRDPLDLAGGDVNLYRYVTNRPFAGGDPSGTSGLADLVAATAANACMAPTSTPPKTPKVWVKGIGPGQCPGDHAWALFKAAFQKPLCQQTLHTYCGASPVKVLQLMIQRLTIPVSGQCKGGTDAYTHCIPIVNPVTHIVAGSRADQVCFSSRLCAAKPRQKACILFWEYGNFCGCELDFDQNVGRPDSQFHVTEIVAMKFRDACGFTAHDCHSGGQFR